MILAVALLLAPLQDKAVIEWKFAQGDAFRYELDQTDTTSVAGRDMTRKSTMGMVMEVAEIDDKGVASLKVTYDRMKFSMTGVMESDYDSERDKEEPEDGFGKMFAALVGKSFTLKMNPHGEVVAVKGYGKMMDDVFDKIGEDALPFPGMRDLFTDDFAKKMMGQSFPKLPAKAVAKGDSWEGKDTLDLPMMGKVALKVKSTLKELREKEAVVEQDSTMEKAEGDDESGATVEVTEATTKAKVTWDTSAGRLASSTWTTTLTASANGQEFTSETRGELKLAPKKK
jgi:hypothetical protein